VLSLLATIEPADLWWVARFGIISHPPVAVGSALRIFHGSILQMTVLDLCAPPPHHSEGSMRNLPSGNVTFLFTDIEGSTKLLHELGGEGYAEALAQHRRVVRQACAAQGGVEVDTQGDAFFFAFPSAPSAAAAAQAITSALAPGRVHLRMGLHTGTPLLTDEGYVGEDVHFAARVGSSGHGGQILLSRTTRELLDSEVVLSDLGEHRLKNIPEAVPFYQLGREVVRGPGD